MKSKIKIKNKKNEGFFKENDNLKKTLINSKKKTFRRTIRRRDGEKFSIKKMTGSISKGF